MIKLLLAISLNWLTVSYKPVHVLDTEGLSCGASERLLKERITIVLADPDHSHAVKVNHTYWNLLEDLQASDEELLDKAGIDPDNGNWGWALKYRVRPDAYMSMDLLFNANEGYLSIQGIDAKRRPCKDAVYLKRVR